MLKCIFFSLGFFIGLLIFGYTKDFIEVMYYNAKDKRRKEND